jgi:hypothetical protein
VLVTAAQAEAEAAQVALSTALAAQVVLTTVRLELVLTVNQDLTTTLTAVLLEQTPVAAVAETHTAQQMIFVLDLVALES